MRLKPVELAAAGAACEMDIFSALANTNSPMTVSEIAKSAKGGDELLVQRIVQGLAAHGMVAQADEGHYQANDVTREYATPGRAAAIMTQLFSTRAYASLPWFLRETNYKTPTNLKNCAWQYAYGTPQTIWEWLKANPEMGGYFNEYMAAGRADSNEDLEDIYPFDKLFEGASKEDVLFVDV